MASQNQSTNQGQAPQLPQRLSNWIGGEFVPPEGGSYLANFEPATGQIYSEVPQSDGRDLEKAIHEAEKALPAWAALPADTRSSVLHRIAEGILAHQTQLATAEATDSGKPLSAARTVDIPRSARNFAFYSDAVTHFASEFHATDSTTLNYTLRSPVGIAGCISPWNFPLYLLTWKVAPALAAGNCVIAKPSEVTPMTAYLFAKICQEAGLPPGVLNIVQGTGASIGAELVRHPGVKAVSFTGSTRTGAEIAKVAGPAFKKYSLEMGGKNPTLIFDDCDMEEAVHHSVRASFTNQGQICTSGSRIYVQRRIYDQFKDAFIEKVLRLKVGDPLEMDTEQGAVVSQDHFKKILSYIDLARQDGAKILIGGEPAHLPGRCQKGWFIQPTVLEGLSDDSKVNQEEIFGPVVAISPFDSEAEAIARANNSRYGLSAAIFSKNIDTAHRVASKLQVGMVWVNSWMVRDLRTPFGGTKDSGVGREGGWEALRFFTEPKNICLQIAKSK